MGAVLFDRLVETLRTDDEVSAALADLRCRQSSGFDAVYRDTIAANIVVFRDENRLNDFADARRHEMDANGRRRTPTNASNRSSSRPSLTVVRCARAE